MKYIEHMLGIQVKYKTWNHEADMPYFILDRYEIRLAVLDTVKTLFLYPKTELDQVNSLKKHIARIQKTESLPIAFILDTITRQRREYLLAAKIPFVVQDKQIYLPFMGVALQEKFDVEFFPIEHLQPASQVLFFYYLYQKQQLLYTKQATKALGFSAMTITRAVRQLKQTGYFTTEKNGVQTILKSKDYAGELFAKMQPYLISPIRKTVYVKKQDAAPELCTAGLSALSKMSMLNPPDVACYAASSKLNNWTGTNVLMDSAAQMELQLWKYDPHILSANDMVDPLSLAASLKDNTDERIEEAVEQLLEKGGINGYRF